MFINWNIRVSRQICEYNLTLLLGRFNCPAPHYKLVFSALKINFTTISLEFQLFLSLELQSKVINSFLRVRYVQEGAFILRFQGCNSLPDIFNFGSGRHKLNFSGLRVNAEQQFSLFDLLIVGHVYFNDPTVNVRADIDQPCLYIGVFGFYISSAGVIEITSHCQPGDGYNYEEKQPGNNSFHSRFVGGFSV